MCAVAQDPDELTSGAGADGSAAGAAAGGFALLIVEAAGAAFVALAAAGLVAGPCGLPGAAGMPNPAGETGFCGSLPAGAGAAFDWGSAAAASVALAGVACAELVAGAATAVG